MTSRFPRGFGAAEWRVHLHRILRLALRRLLVVCVGLVAMSANAVASAGGPRLAVVRYQLSKPPSVELLTVDETGGSPIRLLGGAGEERVLPAPLSAPAWSPSGDLLAFAGLTSNRGDGARGRIQSLFVVNPDGSGLRHLPGTGGAYAPVFAPNGNTVVYARRRVKRRKRRGRSWRFDSTAIWITHLNDGKPQPLTRWRNGLEQVPSSFSPDGSMLAISRIDKLRGGEPEAVLWQIGTGHRRVLARTGREPVFSPDGLRIAFVRNRKNKIAGGSRHAAGMPELFVVNRDGSGLRRLTDVLGGLVGAPNWDPSGERLTYSQTTGGLSLSTAIMEVNADGSCRTKILGQTGAVFFAATWQPGQGRGAGRLECGGPGPTHIK